MDSKRKLGRVISALLAATSVVGQAGAAPKRRPKSAPAAMNNKNVKKKATPDKESFWKHLHENPHNWAHLGLGLTAGGLGGLWLHDKLKAGVKKMVAIALEDACYAAITTFANILLSVDPKTGVPASSIVLTYRDGLEKEANDEYLKGAKFGETVNDAKNCLGVDKFEFSTGEKAKGKGVFLDSELKGDFGVVGTMGNFVKFKNGEYFKGLASLFLRIAFQQICINKKLIGVESLQHFLLLGGRALVLDDENFLRYLGKIAGKGNEGKVKEVWDKVKGFSDLYLEIIKEKSKGRKDNKKDDKEKGKKIKDEVKN